MCGAGTAVPLGLIVRPFDNFGPNEEKIGVIATHDTMSFRDPLGPHDFTLQLVNAQNPRAVLRCEKCRAYVNPFMRFTENGHKVLTPPSV